MPAAPSWRPAGVSSAGSCRPESVLPATARVRRRVEFATALRGSRLRADGLVLHYATLNSARDQQPRAGVIVSRAVGAAAVRNRVRRRIRHLLPPLLSDLPAGSILLVRALPAAAAASSEQLRIALVDGCARLPLGERR